MSLIKFIRKFFGYPYRTERYTGYVVGKKGGMPVVSWGNLRSSPKAAIQAYFYDHPHPGGWPYFRDVEGMWVFKVSVEQKEFYDEMTVDDMTVGWVLFYLFIGMYLGLLILLIYGK